jgi:hypothetical protein
MLDSAASIANWLMAVRGFTVFLQIGYQENAEREPRQLLFLLP